MMKRRAHTIQTQPWQSLSLRERVALEMISGMLWPLPHDARMTVLLNLLAAQLDDMVASGDQVDAIVDVLKLRLKVLRGEG
jgi:hypothetical protein